MKIKAIRDFFGRLFKAIVYFFVGIFGMLCIFISYPYFILLLSYCFSGNLAGQNIHIIQWLLIIIISLTVYLIFIAAFLKGMRTLEKKWGLEGEKTKHFE